MQTSLWHCLLGTAVARNGLYRNVSVIYTEHCAISVGLTALHYSVRKDMLTVKRLGPSSQ
jgi:hypothetical protein